MLIPGGRESRPDSTVDPVVVRPEVVSKNASVKLSSGMSSISGSTETPDIRTQARVTSRKPSRDLSSRCSPRVSNVMTSPAPEVRSADQRNWCQVPSW